MDDGESGEGTPVHRGADHHGKEFRSALLEVVAFHHPGSAVELEEEAASLLKALS